MAKIQSVDSILIFDSRGNPTVKTTINLDDGTTAHSAVPSGASTGKHEAVELRDNDPALYGGKGVLKAIENVKNTIAPAIVGMDASDTAAIDSKMLDLDGTPNKAKLGANAMLSVSQAAIKAAAVSQNLSVYEFVRSLTKNRDSYTMPTPLFNMLEGGAHADNGVDFQEYIVIPASQKSFDDKMYLGVTVYQTLKKMLKEQNMSTLVADEGGFAPMFATNADALQYLKTAVEHAGFRFAVDAFLGLDVAANHFTDTDKYKLMERNSSFRPQELVEYYVELVKNYSLLYFEDPFAEDDVPAWKSLHTSVSENTMIIGDDLTVTNPERLQMALENDAIDGLIVKPNQIGTITESIAVCEMAHFKNLNVIVSHRSGETTDDFIADFAVGVGAEYAKFGAPAHERVAKYNRLLEIHHEITSATPAA